MAKRLNRVTHECLEDGVVVSGKIGSAESWVVAYLGSIDEWQYNAIIAGMLLHQMERIFDSCQEPSDITEHDGWLAAAWNMFSHLQIPLVQDSEIERLRTYEADIRSGKEFEDDASSS